MKVPSIPRTRPGHLGSWITDMSRSRGWSNLELARRTTIAPGTINTMKTTHTLHDSNENVSLWVVVALADAFEVDVCELIEHVSPGHALNVRRADIETARNVIDSRRIARNLPVPRATVESPAPVAEIKAAPTMSVQELAVVPSALDIMLKVKGMSDEDRLLVNEFIDEVLAG